MANFAARTATFMARLARLPATRTTLWREEGLYHAKWTEDGVAGLPHVNVSCSLYGVRNIFFALHLLLKLSWRRGQNDCNLLLYYFRGGEMIVTWSCCTIFGGERNDCNSFLHYFRGWGKMVVTCWCALQLSMILNISWATIARLTPGCGPGHGVFPETIQPQTRLSQKLSNCLISL